jgi:hypothetical protein
MVIVFLIFWTWLCLVNYTHGYNDNYGIEVNLTSINNYSYIGYFNIENNYNLKLLLDTGNSFLTVLRNKTDFHFDKLELISRNDSCTYLTEDGTFIGFTIDSFDYYNECTMYGGKLSVKGDSNYHSISNSAVSSINFTYTDTLTIENPKLHEWKHRIDGDIGLGYSSSSTEITQFQSLLLNISNNNSATFGLDLQPFNNINNNISTMQLGYVKSQYLSDISWELQPSQDPSYHQFFLYDLEICGHDVIHNIATNWQVLVDTGSDCITLPGDIYDNVLSWLDSNQANNNDANIILPSLNFIIKARSGNEQAICIPLESLLIDKDDILYEVAPTVHYKNNEQKLCLLKGETISDSSHPQIVFGTLALHSLYLAGDYSSYSVGLASKLSAAELSKYTSSSGSSYQQLCQVPVKCKGDEVYREYSNSCELPACTEYYFVVFDEDTHTCVYNQVAVAFGVMIIITIVIAEITSFVVLQYSSEYISYNAPSHINDTNVSEQENSFKMDILSLYMGKFCVGIIDWIVLYLLKWVPDLANVNNHE